MLSKKFIIKYQQKGLLYSEYKEVFADSEEEARKTFDVVMGDRCTIIYVQEV